MRARVHGVCCVAAQFWKRLVAYGRMLQVVNVQAGHWGDAFKLVINSQLAGSWL
jgi:hypothetical protein